MEIVLDANIPLHFKRIDQIDWRTLTGERECVLIVTPVLMRELERNKIHNPNSKLRNRARDTILWLADLIERDDPILLRDGVRLAFDTIEPSIDFKEHGLSRDIADDHLIASAISWHQRSNGFVAIATDDSGLAMKLRGRNVGRVKLADDLRLPDAHDAERSEVADLKRQLALERNRKPKLVARFDEGDCRIWVQPLSADDAPGIEDIAERIPKLTLLDLAAQGLGAGVRIHSETAVQSYNRERETFLGKYRDYLGKHRSWVEQERRTIELGFSLANIGRGPATSVDVTLTFPGHLTVVALDGAREEPEPPRPPRLPSGLFSALEVGPVVALPYFRPTVQLEGSPSVSDDGTIAEFWTRALKHDCALELKPLLITFPSAERIAPFEIAVTITCNETDKVEHKLTVLIADSLDT